MKILHAARTKLTPASVAALQKVLPNCKIEWPTDGEFYGQATKLAYLDSAFQQWVKATQALPAKNQIEAVVKKLQELNPAFDGKETHKNEGGIITQLDFATDNVTDISPVRALVGLRELVCTGSSDISRGKLSDLSPLQGMKLTAIHLSYTQVTDLSPLQGMPLAIMSIGGTQVSDLTPLRGMPLRQLFCGNTEVSDLLPLEGCDTLRYLQVHGTHVTAAGVAALQKALPNCRRLP